MVSGGDERGSLHAARLMQLASKEQRHQTPRQYLLGSRTNFPYK
jgi:hypothetical protein